MDKANKAVDMSEQETPFHLLPQEEQQRIIEANRRRVREAETLHEWDVRVKTPFVWIIISIPVGIMMSIGIWLLYSDDAAGRAPIIMGAIVAAYTRYLWLADKNYHYRLTTEGVIVTYQDAIPEMVYTIVRGLAWVGVAVCVIAVGSLGPLALVGAGGMALLAFFFTDFKGEINEEYTLFHTEWSYALTVSKRYKALRIESVPFKSAFSCTIFCRVEDMELITLLIQAQILIEEVKSINGHPGI